MRRFRFRAWRKFRKLRQYELADAAGMSTPNYSRIETGAQPFTRDNLLALAAALKCEPCDLICDFEPGSPEHELVADLRAMPPPDRARIIRLLRAIMDSQAA